MDEEPKNNDPPRKFTGTAKLLVATTVTAVLIASIIGGTRRVKEYAKLRAARKHITDQMKYGWFVKYGWFAEAEYLLEVKGSYTLEDLDLDPSLGSRLLIAVLFDHRMNEQEKCDALRRLLKEGADPNFTDTRATPVIFHARSRFEVNVTLLELLLKEGHANPNIQNGNGSTLLASGGLFRTEALLEAGANPNIPDNSGQTPIFHQRNPKVVERLLEYGADPSIKCLDGYTAVEKFRQWKWLDPAESSVAEICELLEKAEKQWQEKKGAR